MSESCAGCLHPVMDHLRFGCELCECTRPHGRNPSDPSSSTKAALDGGGRVGRGSQLVDLTAARGDVVEAMAEVAARGIRAGRHSGRVAVGPLPARAHNRSDLRDGRRVAQMVLEGFPADVFTPREVTWDQMRELPAGSVVLVRGDAYQLVVEDAGFGGDGPVKDWVGAAPFALSEAEVARAGSARLIYRAR